MESKTILVTTLDGKNLYEGSSFWYISGDESVHGAIMTSERSVYYSERYRIYKTKENALKNSKTIGR